MLNKITITNNNDSNITDIPLSKEVNQEDKVKEIKTYNNGCISIQKMDKAKELMKKSVCKIKCEDKKGTGFLCKIEISTSKSINALITCNHVLSKKQIQIGQEINISFNNEKEKFIITIDESTNTYTNINYDITIIEIKGNEYNKIISFLDIDNDINDENPLDIYKNKSIFVFHYQLGEEVMLSNGKILDLSEDLVEIRHDCETDKGSSGSPIMYSHNFKVIGIHKAGIISEKKNLGIFIKNPINDFIKKYIYYSYKCIKKSNIKRIPKCKDKLLILLYISIILIILVVIFIIIYIFLIKGKDDKINEENVDEENSDDNIDKENIDEENSITMAYKKQIDKFGSIKIFGDEFVESNLYSCKIYYNGKKYNLKNSFAISDMNEKDTILKIQLIGINNIKDIKGMFKGCNALISLTDLSKLNTKDIIDISEIFSGCKSLSNLPNSLNWNTENVQNMSYIFYECESLTSLPDISNWKTNNVIDFSGMFFGCSSLYLIFQNGVHIKLILLLECLVVVVLLYLCLIFLIGILLMLLI